MKPAAAVAAKAAASAAAVAAAVAAAAVAAAVKPCASSQSDGNWRVLKMRKVVLLS